MFPIYPVRLSRISLTIMSSPRDIQSWRRYCSSIHGSRSPILFYINCGQDTRIYMCSISWQILPQRRLGPISFGQVWILEWLRVDHRFFLSRWRKEENNLTEIRLQGYQWGRKSESSWRWEGKQKEEEREKRCTPRKKKETKGQGNIQKIEKAPRIPDGWDQLKEVRRQAGGRIQDRLKEQEQRVLPPVTCTCVCFRNCRTDNTLWPNAVPVVTFFSELFSEIPEKGKLPPCSSPNRWHWLWDGYTRSQIVDNTQWGGVGRRRLPLENVGDVQMLSNVFQEW